jgi:hypothetical protein
MTEKFKNGANKQSDPATENDAKTITIYGDDSPNNPPDLDSANRSVDTLKERPQPFAAASLRVYYSTPRVKPALLIRAIRKERTPAFVERERQEVIANIDQLDAHLAKTLVLAQAVDEPSRDRVVLDWLGEIVLHEMRTDWQWSMEPGATASEIFREIAQVLRPAIERGEKKRKAINLLLISLGWLTSRGLLLSAVLAALEEAIPPLKRGSLTSDERQRLAITELVRMRANPKAMRAVMRTLEPLRTRLRELELDASEKREEVSDIEARASSLEEQLAALQERAAGLAASVTDLTRQLEERDARLTARHNVAQSQLALVQGAINGWLESDVKPRLLNALEAIDSEPPRRELARERLNFILTMIEEKGGGQWT